MCFNAALTKKQRDLAMGLLLPEEEIPELPEYYNVSGFSHPELPLLLNDGGRKRIIRGIWGLVPFWAVGDDKKRQEIRNKTLNARAETIRTLPSFRHLVDGGRCLVIVDGFYEPHHQEETVYPWFCRLPGGEPMTLAGLCSRTGEITFSVITVPASGLLAKIHNDKLRMPRIVRPEEREAWLDPELEGERVTAFLMTDPEEPRLEAWPVSRSLYGRGAAAAAPEIQLPVDYPELQLASVVGKSEKREV